MTVEAFRVIRVSGVSVSRFVERLEGIKLLTRVYRSDHANGIDTVLATGLLIVKAICNTERLDCRITLYHCGGQAGPVADEYSVGYAVKMIFSAAALANGIAWYVDDSAVGITCPHCKATYQYSERRFIDGVSVECQNCAKVFDTRQTPLEVPPTRILGKTNECPFCRARYVYRENDLDEERTASCRNCGVRVAFPGILDEWQEYQQIQDDVRNERTTSE